MSLDKFFKPLAGSSPKKLTAAVAAVTVTEAHSSLFAAASSVSIEAPSSPAAASSAAAAAAAAAPLSAEQKARVEANKAAALAKRETAASRKRKSDAAAAAGEADTDAPAIAAAASSAASAASAAASSADPTKRSKLDDSLTALIPADWANVLAPEFSKSYWPEIERFLRAQASANVSVFPPRAQIFRALDLTPFEQVKVIILGQGQQRIQACSEQRALAMGGGRAPAGNTRATRSGPENRLVVGSHGSSLSLPPVSLLTLSCFSPCPRLPRSLPRRRPSRGSLLLGASGHQGALLSGQHLQGK